MSLMDLIGLKKLFLMLKYYHDAVKLFSMNKHVFSIMCNTW